MASVMAVPPPVAKALARADEVALPPPLEMADEMACESQERAHT